MKDGIHKAKDLYEDLWKLYESKTCKRYKTGFKDFFNIFNDDESKEMGIHTFSFTTRDIVRSEILKFIIKRLDIK